MRSIILSGSESVRMPGKKLWKNEDRKSCGYDPHKVAERRPMKREHVSLYVSSPLPPSMARRARGCTNASHEREHGSLTPCSLSVSRSTIEHGRKWRSCTKLARIYMDFSFFNFTKNPSTHNMAPKRKMCEEATRIAAAMIVVDAIMVRIVKGGSV